MTEDPRPALRALVDVNLLINALLSSNPAQSAAAAVLAEARLGSYDLIVPIEALEETSRVVRSKPWVASRVAPDDFQTFLRDIAAMAEVPPRLEHLPPPICRDAADDYLIAHAMLAGADVLVTRDQDLLDLGEVGSVQIVDPRAFLGLLRSRLE